MKAREIIEAAAQAVEQYKHPNVDEAQALLHSLLKAAGIGGIEGDKIECIDEYSGAFHITTAWTVMQCYQHETYTLPSMIVDADDPLRAATEWRLDCAVAKAEADLDSATRTLAAARERLEAAQEARAQHA